LSEFVGSNWPVIKDNDTNLFQIVLYLAPGDYHGFHAPSNVEFTERRHFCGLLLPVAPWMLRACPSLFEANERVVLLGNYDKNKRMVYAAVGATNVGSIVMKFDDTLVTNNASDDMETKHFRQYKVPVALMRGEEVGFFRMGSTIVMIFEGELFILFDLF
jgi:phosphatidylserine decarboxylase